MLKKGLFAILGSKILFLFKPELKNVLKNILICAIFIFFILYIHSEYIKWSEISENKKLISLSFIIKNLLILLSLIVLFFSIKKAKLKNDGYDKFRNKKLIKESEKKLEAKEGSITTEIDDLYFDQFRNKKKLRTTQEIKLGKK